jgi:23S rRNA (cytidine1920-2'-O)/16S rRNA (cytidine1409-2'-O)-methyltransferase
MQFADSCRQGNRAVSDSSVLYYEPPAGQTSLEMQMKIRLDKALVERGLAGSRERAQALILAGRVLVAEQRVEKPGTPVAEDAVLRIMGEDLRYVSRGGLKLERALEYWGILLEGRACVDVGASTGGFADCMLQNGAVSVLAVDTGYGQIAHKLRVDPRVSLRERCNARLLGAGELVGAGGREQEIREQRTGGGEQERRGAAISFLAMDVSFISATLVLPAVLRALVGVGEVWRGEGVVLIKPQFEAGREHVGKGGIVREQAARDIAIERVKSCVIELGATGVEVIDSPIHGMEGNWENLLHGWFGGEG